MKVVGLEFVVPRIDEATDFFSRVVGLEVVWRGRHAHVAGDAAVLDGESVAITLLQLDDSGPGIVADREPRLSRLTLGSDGDGGSSLDALMQRLERAGVPTRETSRGGFVPPEVMDGVLGQAVALVFDLEGGG